MRIADSSLVRACLALMPLTKLEWVCVQFELAPRVSHQCSNGARVYFISDIKARMHEPLPQVYSGYMLTMLHVAT